MEVTTVGEEAVFTAIKRPVSVLRAMYTSQCTGDHPATRSSIRNHFARSIGSHSTMQLVPCLTPATADLLGDQALVRFRGMVQDVLNPEMFVGAFKDASGAWQTTQWSDTPPVAFEQASDKQLMERVPLYCTPVPGCTAWADARWTGHPCKPSTPRVADRKPTGFSKRTRDEQQQQAAADADTSMQVDQQHQSAAGGTADEGQEAPRKRLPQQPKPAAAAAGGEQPEGTAEGQAEPAAAAAAEEPVPEPLPGDCIAYSYEEEAPKLHDVVEVLGILSIVPGLAAAQQEHQQRHHHRQQEQEQEQQEGGEAAGAAAAPPAGDVVQAGEGGEGPGAMEVDLWDEAPALLPTSQVFRLHALWVRREPAALLPLLSMPRDALTPLLPALRSKVLDLLGLALGGDALAAEYLLLCCCGGVFSRSDLGAHGLLPLNLTGCPAAAGAAQQGAAPAPGFVAALCDLLEQLLPAVARLAGSLAALNSSSWAPRKDYNRGRLVRGALQLARGTLVVVDETGLATGQLQERGVRNLQALQSVIQQQQLPVDLQFYQHPVPTDLPVLVLSTTRCLLKDAGLLQLPLAPAAPHTTTPDAAPSSSSSWGAAAQGALEGMAASDLDLLRDYLLVVRGQQCELQKETAEQLTQQYVSLHAADGAFDGERFSNCIAVCKLLCVSHGLSKFDMSMWQAALQLEQQRLTRVAAAAPTARPVAAQPAASQ